MRIGEITYLPKAEGQCFRITVHVANRVLGPLFGYEGSFTVEERACLPATSRPTSSPHEMNVAERGQRPAEASSRMVASRVRLCTVPVLNGGSM